jgi:predicted nucleic acid-binding protein
MKVIFMDANGWIALNNKRDQLHSIAIRTHRKLLTNGYRYVTTNFILDETYTGLLTKVSHFAAVDFGEKLHISKIVSIIHITKDIEEEAWKVFKKYSDEQFSFTDCTSFVVMGQLNLTEAFTSDRHFEQMGLIILLEAVNNTALSVAISNTV